MCRLSAVGLSFVGAVIIGIGPTALAVPMAADGRTEYRDTVLPFLTHHCLACHGGDEPNGDLRLDKLDGDFKQGETRELWQRSLEQLRAGAMPPEPKPRPSKDEVDALARWVADRIVAADSARRAAEGRVVLRRLNRTEYENTVRELLGVTVDLKELLPLDSSADGFDNVGDALHVSSFLMDRYLEAVETALNRAIANGPQPPAVRQRYHLTETHQVRSTTEDVFRQSDDGRVVMFSSSAWQSVTLSPFYPSDEGNYRFRIAASGVQSSGKPVTYRVDAGSMLTTGKPHLVGYFDAAAETAESTPTIVEFIDRLEPRNTIRILPHPRRIARPSRPVASRPRSHQA